MADSRDIVVSVNVIRDPRGAVIQTQLIKNEPPYVRAGIVTTIVGKDGSLIYTGSGVPSNELGVFTDIYIDTDTPKNFYQKNSSNVWVLKGSLQGGKGDDGREVLIQNNGTYIQWQYEGDVSWTNIVEVATLKGDTGSNIELQKSLTHIQWRVVGDVDWINLIAITDLKGADGRGIVSFDLINTVGKTKTYRLLYTDATSVDINIVDGNDGNDGAGAYQIYVVGGGTLSEVDFNESITDIPAHIGDETIHHTIEQLNLLYSDINHNHNLNDLTEKSYNSLTDKPDLSSLHTHANKEDLDNYDPDNFEPANSNIQDHIADTNIHIDSSSELGEDINETNHSLLLWNGLKALKVTFARLKTWIGSYFLKLDQSTQQTLTDSPIFNNLTAGQMCYVDSNKKLVAIPVYWDAVNKRMGVNVNNPQAPFVIQFGTGQIRFGASNGRTIQAYSSTDVLGNFDFHAVQSYFNSDILLASGKTFRMWDAASTTTNNTISMDIDGSLTFKIGNQICSKITSSKGLKVVGGIQCGDDTAAASADKKGTTRYREWEAGGFGYSAEERCMKTGINQYTWVAIVTNSWSL